MRLSTSFSEEELAIMEQILGVLLKGGGANDLRVLMKRKSFGKLCGRIKTLRARAGVAELVPASAVEETPDVLDDATAGDGPGEELAP